MSTSPTPATPPTQSSPSNQRVDPTMALIALIHQSLQQNDTMMAQIHSRPSQTSALQPSSLYQYKPQRAPFPKLDDTPPTTPLFFAQVAMYKPEAFYARVHNWTCTTPESRQLGVAISSDILASLPSSISLMFLNDARFVSDGIAILSSLLNHLNLSSNKNLLLPISDLTCLEIRLGKFSIHYMLSLRGILQGMQGIKMEHIIPLFTITSLDHDRYPGMKSRYLAGDTSLCDILKLISFLSRKDIQQLTLGIPSSLPSATVSNCVFNTSTQPPLAGRPAPHPP